MASISRSLVGLLKPIELAMPMPSVCSTGVKLNMNGLPLSTRTDTSKSPVFKAVEKAPVSVGRSVTGMPSPAAAA